jgi:hypothetical protein
MAALERVAARDVPLHAPEFDALTAVVWDGGLPTRAAIWQRRHSQSATPARFQEARAQLVRERPELADELTNRLATELKRGYLWIDFELIPTRHRVAIAGHYARLARYGRLDRGDSQSKTRLVRYNEPFARSAQVAFCPFVSQLTGQRLIPTFTYTASYPSNGNLPFHYDRAQCEVTLALCVDRCEVAAGRSLLCIVDGAVTACGELRPGWGLIFRGRRLPHGRVTIGLGSDQPTVMLLHYVDHKFDGELM